MTRYYLSMVLMGFLFPGMAQQQSLLSTAGGNYQTSSISVSWSLGETVTETFSVSNNTSTQGFQQSKLEPVGIIDQKNLLTSAIEVFPNPTQGLVYLKLNLGLLAVNDLPDHFILYNILGEQLAQGTISEEQPIIDLTPYSGAVYYLKFFNLDSNKQSTIIIQKIN